VRQWTKRNNEENEMSARGRWNLPVESIEVSVNKKGSCLLAVHKCGITNLCRKATGGTEFHQLSDFFSCYRVHIHGTSCEHTGLMTLYVANFYRVRL